MLQDESLEYIRQQYEEKNMVLEQFGEQVTADTFYEDIFVDMDMEIPVVIIDDDEEKRIRVMSVEDAVSFSAGRNDVLMGGCSYFNNWISKKSAKDIYTFIIDYDNAYSGVLLRALQDDWKSANGEPFAKPTYIVNSGTGLHLYFVLSEPIPNYHVMTEQLDNVYRSLAVQQSRRVYVKTQVQWFGQDFRMAGGLNKYDWENTIFRIGEKWDIDRLAEAVGVPGVHFIRYGEKRVNGIRKARIRKQPRRGWKSHKGFYKYSLDTCREKTKEGSRYMSMCALSVIAWKCGVPLVQLEEDLKSLLPDYNKDVSRQIREKEIYSAMKMYNDKAMLTQRRSLEHWQGWEYNPAIRRNGRKRAQHLQYARGVKNLKKQMGEAVNDGRPKGSGTKQQIVVEWQKQNPKGTKAECIRETCLSKPTVYKWWNGGKDHE